MSKVPLYRALRHQSVDAVLVDGEFITAFDCCDSFYVVGTNFGALWVFDLQGDFLIGHKTPQCVTCVHIRNGFILSGGAQGHMQCWDWFGSETHELAQGNEADSPITCLYATLDFSFTEGAVFFAKRSGILVKKSRSFFGYSDSILFRAPRPARTENAESSQITNLRIHLPYIVFACRGSVYLYHEKRGKLIGRFASTTEKENDGNNSQDIDVIFNKEHFMVRMSDVVYVCERDLDAQEVFTVSGRYKAQGPISSLSMLGSNIVLLFEGSVKAHTSDEAASFDSIRSYQVAVFTVDGVWPVDMLSLPADLKGQFVMSSFRNEPTPAGSTTMSRRVRNTRAHKHTCKTYTTTHNHTHACTHMEANFKCTEGH
eukprot:Colp12_sorted_trinity150504_noHs@30058